LRVPATAAALRVRGVEPPGVACSACKLCQSREAPTRRASTRTKSSRRCRFETEQHPRVRTSGICAAGRPRHATGRSPFTQCIQTSTDARSRLPQHAPTRPPPALFRSTTVQDAQWVPAPTAAREQCSAGTGDRLGPRIIADSPEQRHPRRTAIASIGVQRSRGRGAVVVDKDQRHHDEAAKDRIRAELGVGDHGARRRRKCRGAGPVVRQDLLRRSSRRRAAGSRRPPADGVARLRPCVLLSRLIPTREDVQFGETASALLKNDGRSL
jgi:hypothetical protein